MPLSELVTDHFKPPVPLQTAVLFLVFNRPDTTVQVFEAIRKAKPPRLYVAADGPRSDRAGEAEKVARVREIATAVDWPCEVRTLFREKNFGCKYAVSGAITWFFEQEEQGIILEDDCVPSQSFFWFCQEMLQRYKACSKIMSVSGTNINGTLNSRESYSFSIYALMWGWASWRRAWTRYELEMESWPSRVRVRRWKTFPMLTYVENLIWLSTFNKTFHNEVNTWDYQWIYSCWINDGITILSNINLVKNIGYSSDATHTKENHPILSYLVEHEMQFPLIHPPSLEANKCLDKFISRHWFGVNWKTFIKAAILRIPGVKVANEIRKRYRDKTY